MNIIKVNEVKLTEGGPVKDLFMGKVERQNWVSEEIAKDLRVGIVTFSPGARTKFHTHTFEQVLIITEGKGIVATENEEQVVTPGTVIFFPTGENHWHGATENTMCSHITIMTPGKTIFD